MLLGTAQCSSPACNTLYEDEVAKTDTFLKCPICSQNNSIISTKEVDGLCATCHEPMDSHIFGRVTFACPPKKEKTK
jgi:hypothetical protein